MPSTIEQGVRSGQLEYQHYTLARFIAEIIPAADEFSLWLAVVVNRELASGHVCLPFAALANRLEAFGQSGLLMDRPLAQLIEDSPVVGVPGDALPLIASRQRLYLNRFYHNEQRIARTLQRMARASQEIDAQQITAIGQVFPATAGIDYQQLAAIICLRHRLAIISGGPGTGKTYTVGRILKLLRQFQPQLRIRLAAPTGKAAARLGESIQAYLAQDEALEAVTLHRLLGIDRYTQRPRHDRRHPLACDLLIVDEASMVDQQMMARLCAALPSHCRLILLGDKDQLSSVEAGSVFADLCGGLAHTRFSPAQQRWLQRHFAIELATGSDEFGLADQVVVLQRSHRFAADSSIGRLARAINQGDADDCIRLLHAAHDDEALTWWEPGYSRLPQMLEQQALTHFLPVMQADSIEEAFVRLRRFRILAAVWQGPGGVEEINRIVERRLASALGLAPDEAFYAGKPLMMLRNLYQYEIFNGDIGILWPDESGELCAWFETGPGEYRYLSLAQLPHHCTAYAMTIHKSQGSEFERVLITLPPRDSDLLTRELFYTAVTRTSSALEIWSQEDIIHASIQRITRRVSGLTERLNEHE